jgi:hypothetical protein
MDPHPNARGHALLAKGLEDTLVADGYLPKPQVEEARTR